MATIRALECLVAIADSGSFTAAAARLHMSQPALSNQVRNLEQEIGTAIVDRLPRGVRLTAAGDAMLEPARSASIAVARALALGTAAATGRAGTLRLGCAESMTANRLRVGLSRWRTTHPDVAIELTERLSSDHLVSDVLLGNIDLAIGPLPSPVALEITPVMVESFQLLVAPDHPFAGRKAVTLSDLAGQPLVHLHPANGLAGWLDAVAASAGLVLTPVVRVRTTATVAALASAGLGVGVVPEDTPGDRRCTSIPFDPPLTRELVAIHRAPASPLIRMFCSVVRESAQTMSA